MIHLKVTSILGYDHTLSVGKLDDLVQIFPDDAVHQTPNEWAEAHFVGRFGTKREVGKAMLEVLNGTQYGTKKAPLVPPPSTDTHNSVEIHYRLEKFVHWDGFFKEWSDVLKIVDCGDDYMYVVYNANPPKEA